MPQRWRPTDIHQPRAAGPQRIRARSRIVNLTPLRESEDIVAKAMVELSALALAALGACTGQVGSTVGASAGSGGATGGRGGATGGRGGTGAAGGAVGGAAGAAVSGDDFVSGVSIAVHPQTTTILNVTWTQAKAADQTWLEFTFS